MVATTAPPKPAVIDFTSELVKYIPTLAGFNDSRGMNKHHVDEALNGRMCIIRKYPMPFIDEALQKLVNEGVLTKDANNYYHKT